MFTDATPAQINAALMQAHAAFLVYRQKSGAEKATFLRAVASEIEGLGMELIQTAMRETNLPEARLLGERGRTCNQLRGMADLVEEGSWVQATIETALPDRQPLPKPDIRNMRVPIGPVVVFGASNFPFAYSTAGGDSASAWAAGCPVVVKAHPAHPETSEMVAQAILKAVEQTEMPVGTFAHLHGASFEVGKTLVMHPKTAAVGFTGSFAGGKALFDWANQRPVPIPVFAEMGSTNPIFLLPNALENQAEKYAKMVALSVTGSMGQFCTKPGFLIGVAGTDLEKFTQTLTQEIKKTAPAAMLHAGIAEAFRKKRSDVLAQANVQIEVETTIDYGQNDGIPSLASVLAAVFLQNPTLHQEVFGPFALLVKCQNMSEMQEVAAHLEGQLTCTLIATEQDLNQYPELPQTASLLCGRLILNSVPTGVEVCAAMQHGGPFPASSDGRTGSVGAHSIERFVRPFAMQGFQDAFLPAELQNVNPLGIWRMVNKEWTKAGV